MHIVLDARTATDHFPGIGRYIVNLAQSISRMAPNLSISLLHDSSSKASRLVLPDLPRIACPVSPFSIRQQWIVPRQLRKMEATLYHSPYYLMPYRPCVPTILTCHDLIPLIYPAYFSSCERLIYRLSHMLAFKTADLILAVSQATKADLIRYFRIRPDRILVTPEAADTHFHPPPPAQIASVQREYALPERYILYLGTNKPHKNLARLMKAFAQCETANLQSIKLVIAGHWDKRFTEAIELSERPGLKRRVIFIGPVDDADLPAIYGGAILFVFPSLYEGFGIPVLEAMACGTPVVCSNTSSLPEVVGDAAILVNPVNVNDLAIAIGRVLKEEGLSQQMREKGLERAKSFSWERTAEETLAAYKRMALGRTSR